jgi:Flp pilus assembly protein TadD
VNGLHTPFIWDDETGIVSNQTIRSVLPLSDSLSPPLETPVAGRPIVNLSFALNYAMGGLDETGYHVWNLAVLLASALLLFGIVRRALAESLVASGFSRTFRKGSGADAVALVSSLVWLVHPLLSETVDYVTQRTESMMGLFFLLTLYAAIRARRLRHSAKWHTVSIVSCALGMATKESMAVAPLAVLLYDRVFEFESWSDAVKARGAFYACLAATWVELGVLMWRWPRSTVGVATVSPWMYLVNQIQMIARYVGLAFWPRSLVLDYGLPRSLAVSAVVPEALLLLLMLAGTVIALARWPAIGFLGAMFFLTLAPTSSVVPIASEVGAERRMYLPLAALVVLAVTFGWLVLERLRTRWPAQSRTLLGTAVCAVVVMVAALAVRTTYRNREYATPISVWESVVARRPQGRARSALANELMAAGRHDEAIAQLREAARDYPDARAGLGTELFFQGHPAEAIGELDPFVRANPTNPNRIPARLMLGQALMSQGQIDEGASQFKAVLDLDGSNGAARQGLATSYRILAARLLERGNSAQAAVQAAVQAREAVRLNPADAEAHNLLGVALASQGQFAEAAQEFRQTLQIDPKHPSANNNMARALALDRR